MARNYSPQLLGDPHVTVTPLEEYHFDESPCNSNNTLALLIHITATFTCPHDDDYDDDNDVSPFYFVGRSVTFSRTFSLSPDAFAGGRTAAGTRGAVVAMLSEVHIPASFSVDFIVNQILDCCASRMAVLGDGSGKRQHLSPRIKTLSVNAIVDVFVDELPHDGNTDDDNYVDNDDDLDRDIEDDYKIRFVPASKESIEGLKAARIGKPMTCTVCLDDILAGSEATQLPCSHCYHVRCIVEWLQKNKLCPLCRFEMP